MPFRSPATARDRDRIRLQVLEAMGWRIHRVWSVEWFRSPRRALDRLLEAVRQARAGLLKPRFRVESPPARPREAADADVPDGCAPGEGGPVVPDYEYYTPRTPCTPRRISSRSNRIG